MLAHNFLDLDTDGRTVEGVGEVCSGIGLPRTHRLGASVVSDCDDDNASIYQSLQYTSRDQDGDGVFAAVVGEVCTGQSLPPGYSATAVSSDCDDHDSEIFESVIGFGADADGDGVGDVEGSFCTAGELPAGATASRDLFPDDAERNLIVGLARTGGPVLDQTGEHWYDIREGGAAATRGPLGGSAVWQRHVGQYANNLDLRTTAWTLDSDGNVYIAGYFKGKIDFDPTRGRDFHVSTDFRSRQQGSPDGFVTRINADGSYGWTFVFGGPQFDYADDVVALSPNRIMINGFVSNRVYEGTPSATIDVSPDDPAWGLVPAGTDGKGILIELDGEGQFADWRTYFDASSHVLTVAGDTDAFYVIHEEGSYPQCVISRHVRPSRIEPAPGAISAQSSIPDCGNTRILRLDRLVVTNDHEVYYSGLFGDYHVFLGQFLAVSVSNDFFLWKLDRDLRPIWARAFGSPRSDSISDLALDAHGRLYLRGVIGSAVNFTPDEDVEHFGLSVSPGAPSAFGTFLMSLNEIGEPSWFLQFRGTALGIGQNQLAVTPGGRIRASGISSYSGVLRGPELEFEIEPSPPSEGLTSIVVQF